MPVGVAAIHYSSCDPKKYDDYLYRLRNQIPFALLFERLDWPHKRRDGKLAFLCPRCQEYHSAVNPRTNLARCFHCQTNFNPIDMTMEIQECDFVAAVHYLKALLPPDEGVAVAR